MINWVIYSWPSTEDEFRKVKHDFEYPDPDDRTIYKDPEIAAYTRSQQVASIIHSSLASKAVVFSILSAHFDHRTDAYKLILDQFGCVVGGFNPISMRGTRTSGELIIATEFRDVDIAEKAISTVDGTQYKATPYKDNASSTSSLIRVNLTIHRLEEDDVLLPKLMSSSSGKVCQIKKYFAEVFLKGNYQSY